MQRPDYDPAEEERYHDAQIAKGAKNGTEARYVTLTPAASIIPDRMSWIWENRWPTGAVALVPGEEGQGKTALVGHLAARLTRGDLPGDRYGRPGHVIYVGCEDDRATVLVPRLIAADADLDRFHFVDVANGWQFSAAGDADALTTAMAGLDVAAIIIDPLDSHLGQADTHRKSEVQSAIARLAQLAQDRRCVAVGIAHFNKGTAATVRLKVVGSIGFTSAARAVIAVGPHPEHPDTEKVAVLAKVNGGNLDVPAIRFKIEAHQLPHPDGGRPIVTPRVVLLGEQSGLNPNSIITSGSAEERSALDEAVEWLTSVLSDGPVERTDIVKWARSEGISDRTLGRAKEHLKVVSERDDSAKGRPASWSLPDYWPRVIGQTALANNPQRSDQGQHTPGGGYWPRFEPWPITPADLEEPGPGLRYAEARADEIRRKREAAS